MSFPRTLAGMWSEINKRYFDRTLPAAREMRFKYVPDKAEGTAIDTRDEAASATLVDGRWVLEVNESLRDFPTLVYLKLVHEAVHVKLPAAAHGSKEWNKEVRRLTGKDLLRRVF